MEQANYYYEDTDDDNTSQFLPVGQYFEQHNQSNSTVLKFDSHVPSLLWSGNNTGHLTSYEIKDESITCYSRYYQKSCVISDIISHKVGIISISNCTSFTKRHGVPIWTLPSVSCATLFEKDFLLTGSLTSSVISLQSLEHPFHPLSSLVIDKTNTRATCVAVLNSCNFVAAGTTNGVIKIIDPSLRHVQAQISVSSGSSISSLVPIGQWGLVAEVTTKPSEFYYIDLRKSMTAVQSSLYVPIGTFITGLCNTNDNNTLIVGNSSGYLQPYNVMNDDGLLSSTTTEEGFDSGIYNASKLAVSDNFMALSRDADNSLSIWKTRKSHKNNDFSLKYPTTPPTNHHYCEKLDTGIFGIKRGDDRLLLCSDNTLQSDKSGAIPLPRVHRVIKPEIMKTAKDFGGIKTVTLSSSSSLYVSETDPRNKKKKRKDKDGDNGNGDKSSIPKAFQKPLVTLSKSVRSVAAFDFKSFNKVKHRVDVIGLENDFGKYSYIARYTNVIVQLLYHIPSARFSDTDNALYKELAYVYKMLDTTENVVCHTSNFITTLALECPKAVALGLLDPESSSSSSNLLTKYLRLLMEPAKDVFSITRLQSNTCVNASHVTTREDSVCITNVVETSSIEESLTKQSVIKAWCSECELYCDIKQSFSLVSLPEILVFESKTIPTESFKITSEDDVEVEFNLIGVISKISESDHFVLEMLKNNEEWVVFNDFRISSTTLKEVVKDSSFKTPHILVYKNQDINISLEALSVKQDLKNSVVAMDTEFVSIELEQADVSVKGKRVVTNHGRKAIARVSIIDDATSSTLVDDYVIQTETVLDYATRFSGITPSDLDPNNSSSKRSLVTRAEAFEKIMKLVDSGAIFVGHGLETDFRIINCVVPASQVRDTVDLFHLPKRRKLSLRFLTILLLQSDIQQATHDSVEDARAALKLYHIYKSIEHDEFTTQVLMTKIYDAGESCKWKISDLSEEARRSVLEVLEK